jgi:hypothetical protein
MAFYQRMVSDLLNKDGILVLGRGLGLHQTVARFVRLYISSRDHLVFVVNGSARLYETYRELLLAGCKPAALRNFSFVDANVSQAERTRMYVRACRVHAQIKHRPTHPPTPHPTHLRARARACAGTGAGAASSSRRASWWWTC